MLITFCKCVWKLQFEYDHESKHANDREVSYIIYHSKRLLQMSLLFWSVCGWNGCSEYDGCLYQCSGMNDPAATAISIRRPWAQWPAPGTLYLCPDCRRPWAHSAGRRYGPWRHRNPAGFGCGLSENCYWHDPSQLIVIFCNYFMCLYIFFSPSNICFGLRFGLIEVIGFRNNWKGIKQEKYVEISLL